MNLLKENLVHKVRQGTNAKSEMLNKEMRGEYHQQPRKEILQRKYFTPNY